MRLERKILIGRDAVLSWKNILTSVFCIIASGFANDALNAQTTSQGYTRPNQYYQSSQLADRSSFRERLRTGETSARQNSGTESTRRPLTSSEIWSNFLFGGVQRQSSSMKFAFSRKTTNNGNGVPTQNSQRPYFLNGNVQQYQSVYAAQNVNQLDAMRQAGESFNAENNAVATPAIPQNEPYVAENRVTKRTAGVSDAEERLQRIAELNAVLDSRASNAQLVSNDSSNLALNANRSRIRQTSGLERRNVPVEEQAIKSASVVEREALPVRPQALQISPRVFISTEVVQLPQAGALVEEATDAETPEADPLVAATTKEEKAPEAEPKEEDVVYSIPTFNSLSEAQEKNAQVEAVAPLPLAPVPQNLETKSSNSRVMRSRAKFLDPRSI